MERRWIYCPECKRKLFRTAFCDLEIKCKCGETVVIRVYTASALLLTADKESDMIVSVSNQKRSANPVAKHNNGESRAS